MGEVARSQEAAHMEEVDRILDADHKEAVDHTQAVGHIHREEAVDHTFKVGIVGTLDVHMVVAIHGTLPLGIEDMDCMDACKQLHQDLANFEHFASTIAIRILMLPFAVPSELFLPPSFT